MKSAQYIKGQIGIINYTVHVLDSLSQHSDETETENLVNDALKHESHQRFDSTRLDEQDIEEASSGAKDVDYTSEEEDDDDVNGGLVEQEISSAIDGKTIQDDKVA